MKRLKGIDVSEWQDTGLDYATMAKSIDFVIVREGYRKTMDKMFLAHVRGFSNANVPIQGVYHFIYALNNQQAKEEALNCIQNVQAAGLPKSTYIWCDFEYDTVDNAKRKGINLGPNECRLFTKTFCETVKEAGYPTGVYTNLDYAKNMYGEAFLANYPLWYAQYASQPAMKCMIWQYSSKGRIPGFWEDLDMDYLYVDEESVKPEEDASANKIKTEAQAIDKVLAIANAEVGYHEKASAANLNNKTANSGSNNYTKYNKEMHQVQPSNMDYPAQWCDCFVDWCMYKAFGLELARKVLCGTFDDYTVYSADMYKQAGRWSTTGHRGDQIFFANSSGICHTGLVEKVENGIVYTIEGNVNDAVRKRQFNVNDSYIAGYGRPKYNLVVGISDNDVKPVEPSKPTAINKTPRWVGEVTADALNVRIWAGTEYPNIKSWPILKKTNLVDVCDTIDDSKGNPWYYIRIAGKYYGFVSAKYIKRV